MKKAKALNLSQSKKLFDEAYKVMPERTQTFSKAPAQHDSGGSPKLLMRASGCNVWDVDGNKYLDMVSAYSAVSHGHSHPELVKTIKKQSEKLAITSRAFYTEPFAKFLEKLSTVSGFESILTMNTGAEAVETAIKAARRWGYFTKGIPENKAEIIVADGNFHGRTTTIVGFSSEPSYKKGFGPFDGGFKEAEYCGHQCDCMETCSLSVESFKSKINKNKKK